ncbi:glycoside hydrolase family 113 [Priestia filamentosa]|uniref:glycoside hydrolase family 113 n=1 Tax=Priestia filamentosa TaxID=1402861 RepID=UPI00398195C9
MKKKVIIYSLLVLVLLSAIYLILNPKKEEKHKGISITLFDQSNNDEWYDENLPKIKEMGAELEVVTVVTINNKNDSLPINDPKISEKLERLFAKSKEYGVKVSLIKPHIMYKSRNGGIRDGDRAHYNPSDVNLFFSRWNEIMLYYAAISKEHNVPVLSLSSETTILTQSIYTRKWQEIIRQVKLIYPDLKLTIAFRKPDLDRELNYHESKIKSVSTILDYVSLNMYPKVKRLDKNTKIEVSDDYFVVDLGTVYGYVEAIKKAKKYFNKDVLITETGVTTRSDKSKNYIAPITLDETKPKDYGDQSSWTTVVLGILLQMDEVKGIYIWHANQPFDYLANPIAQTIKELYKQ